MNLDRLLRSLPPETYALGGVILLLIAAAFLIREHIRDRRIEALATQFQKIPALMGIPGDCRHGSPVRQERHRLGSCHLCPRCGECTTGLKS